MRNRIKYPKTDDAVRAYKEYAAHHFSPCSFETWINVDDGITPTGSTTEQEENKRNTKDDWFKAGYSFGNFGLGALCAGVKTIIDSNPYYLAKSMQMSPNSDVREYGYRMEFAIERERYTKKAASEATDGAETTK